MENNAARRCRRPACPRPATASLSYRYDTSQVWLLDLSAAPDPSLYDLCATHADATTVPRGWERVDERPVPPAVPEAADRDLVAVGSGTPAVRSPSLEQVEAPPAARRMANRYDRLRRDLPRVAAQLSVERRPERRPEPVPSRDLAPVAFREALGRRWRA